MRKKITTVYVFLVSIVFSIAFTFRLYRIWSKIYALLFVPKRIRNLLPLLRSNPDEALTRALKIPYVPDGFKQLGDVCAPPGVLESKIIAIESEPKENFDREEANDCDDYARLLANSLDSSLHPYMASIISIDRQEMKAGIFPKFPGHCVCLWVDLNEGHTGTIYHMGNWNSKKNNSREFGYTTFLELAEDMSEKMGDDKDQVMAWLIMDPDLRTCAWGMGKPPALSAYELIELKPVTWLG